MSSDADEPTRAISLGTIGRFRIIRSLGRGGMGEVYLADDPRLNRSVALKLLNTNVANDPERRAFFEREATSAAALNHPNICTIFEVGEADGRPYIAMEAVEGRTLSSMLKDGRLAVDSVISIAVQVAGALEEARERQVVHRDLKTANIMVTPKGAVKVLDFGLAKRVPPTEPPQEETTSWVSRTAIVFGTLPYMSPEQALGRAVDHRSDLFSLGTIMYEALTARLPFDGLTTPEVLNAIVNREQAPIETRNERVPPALSMVVSKLLEKDPTARYQTGAEVVDDLRSIQQTGDLARRRAAVSRRRLLIASAVAGAVIVIGSVAAWWRTHRITVSSSIGSQPMVVVPATVTGPPQFQFLADAIPNSLTTRLSEHGGIKMKVPPTSIEFGNVSGNLVRVADSYGVTMCIVPRATVASGRLTVNVQVVEPRRRDVVWSGEFESPVDRYAEAIARAADGVAVVLTGRRLEQPEIGRSSTTSAIEFALSRGQYYGVKFNTQYQQSDYEVARAAYMEALQIEPRAAAAAAGLAYLEIFAMQGGKPPDRALPTIDQWARRAIDFDDHNPLGWAALAVAESWRTPANHAKQLEYGFRAASLGEACGRCQLALMMGLQHFSPVLRYHTAAHDADLDPLSAYGHLNSAVALTALGRSDEASAAIARAAAIEPNALWVSVLRSFVKAASGSLQAAAADAEALAALDSLKTMPPWIGRILDMIRAAATGDEREIAQAVERLREPARHGRATEEELMYLANIVTPVLARAGHTDAALTILADVTAADAPPPFDMVVLNPFLKRLMNDTRASVIVARSRASFDHLLEAIRQARTVGRFPRYLEQPLQDLLSALRDSGRAG
jgi:serine/threonine protein kinase/tetratricopeptide (TPR) repeat protein